MRCATQARRLSDPVAERARAAGYGDRGDRGPTVSGTRDHFRSLKHDMGYLKKMADLRDVGAAKTKHGVLARDSGSRRGASLSRLALGGVTEATDHHERRRTISHGPDGPKNSREERWQMTPGVSKT